MKGFKSTICSSLLIAGTLTLSATEMAATPDSIPSGFSKKLEWRVGASVAPAWVIPTDPYYKGWNHPGDKITTSLSEDISAAFSFSPETREGILYPGMYQGAGLGIRSYFNHFQLGTPGTFYLFQGAPFHNFGTRLHLGYEWKFGIAFGWHHTSYEDIDYSSAISTAVTAHMAVALKLQYDLTDNWLLSMALEGTHFSNGNTSWRNGGLNSVGLTMGAAYIINPVKPTSPKEEYADLKSEADKGEWFYDITAYGAWRLRMMWVDYPEEVADQYENPSTEMMCPGKYGVAGINFSPKWRLNRWFAIGPGADIKWDGSAGMTYSWVPTQDPELMVVKFNKPSFGHQLSAGISAHAELTTPIFAINAGLGFNILNPKGDKRFYQSLTFKAFVTRNLFLNIGYSLGNFKTPHNLMLGIGTRIY